MTKAALSIAGLNVFLRRNGSDHLVLDDIGFEAMPGEIIAIVGESGSGKSTLGAAIQGLLPASNEPKVSGSIRLAGTEIVGAKPSVLRAARHSLVRAIPQDPMGALNPTMTIRRQLRESASGNDGFVRDWLSRVETRGCRCHTRCISESPVWWAAPAHPYRNGVDGTAKGADCR